MCGDVAGAAEWLATLPAGAGRDQAIAGWSENARKVDPVGAMAWASRIADAETRRSTQTEVVSSWEIRDPRAAAVWVKSQKDWKPADR